MSNVKIEAKELRQGNIIDVLYSSLARPSTPPKHITAIVRGTDDKTVITDCAGCPNEEQCSGIPLTEEWLVKFGFVKDSIDGNFYLEGSRIYPIYRRHIYFNINGLSSCCKDFQYVHQLQNLYFCLCGEELTPTKQ